MQSLGCDYSSMHLLVHYLNLHDPTKERDIAQAVEHRHLKSFDYPIDPAQSMHLQFGLFSVLTSGPQLAYQNLWYVLSCLWEIVYERSLAAYQKE